MLRLEGISHSLSFQENPFLENLQKELWREYEKILIQEEMYWKQVSRCEWIKFGDKNSKYFHNIANNRRRRNRVLSLKNDEGDWVEHQNVLKDMGVNYFQSIFVAGLEYDRFYVRGAFPPLTDEELASLDREVTDEEISNALFSMKGWKAPGLDGILAAFFQSKWELVKEFVCKWVIQIFQNPEDIKLVNKTFLSLIHKVDSP